MVRVRAVDVGSGSENQKRPSPSGVEGDGAFEDFRGVHIEGFAARHGARLGFHFVEHCFIERYEYLSEGFRLGLVLTDFRLELRMMVNERLNQNCGSYFIRSLHR